MRIIGSIGLALALTAAAPLPADGWRMADTGGSGADRSAYFIDSYSVVRSGETVRFRTSTIFENITQERDWDRSITTREGNCTTKSSTIVENRIYARGALIETVTTRGNTVTHGPESLMRAVLNMVCGDEAYGGPVVADPVAAARAAFAKLDK